MNHNAFRWIITAIFLLLLVFLLSCPYIAGAEGAKLPMDYLEGGKPPKADGWTFDGKYPVSYEDSTIQVSFEREIISHELYCGPKEGEIAEDESWVVRIKIQDVSQLRTAIAMDTYAGDGQADAAAIANSKNAVVAMNGDFFKYENDRGYVVRQGELIRDATDNGSGFVFDTLIIDSEGDFHVVYGATTEKIEAFVKESLEPDGRTILDTFSFGPVLIDDGRLTLIAQSEAALQETYEWRNPSQRIAIIQTGHLEYAIVEIAGKGQETSGLTMIEFGEFVQEKCPDAIFAYNLDGGGSTSLVAWKSAKAGRGEMICRTPGHRNITDILYFASAED